MITKVEGFLTTDDTFCYTLEEALKTESDFVLFEFRYAIKNFMDYRCQVDMDDEETNHMIEYFDELVEAYDEYKKE